MEFQYGGEQSYDESSRKHVQPYSYWRKKLIVEGEILMVCEINDARMRILITYFLNNNIEYVTMQI